MPHSNDPDIICFKHCGNDIFMFSVPNRCPLCNGNLEQCREFLPFTLPYPFISATESPCSVILRPSRGDFLRDFHNRINLHIALTDSRGSIVEFDSPGLMYTASKNVDKSLWKQCLLIAKVPESWFGEWDRQIYHVARERGWDQMKYDEQTLNCYSFVLDFVRLLRYDSLTANDSFFAAMSSVQSTFYRKLFSQLNT
ncbi:MKRN2 opposite strand protein isoform X2 [Toxorhynchites rutilus septentrionalis]|uniref:MKRN2 opposite strand protein isoform X2 n=1 Tax=Toxorhynchites rutilus septentrionalis TaxID=329112 RepID=UPI002479F460|nr:MKRN2 opposite strand protein isoform X2 [Toxorhynchites rutilus septentrionalis]XP_055637824.1 MKRN2 opposite strand protein isoform X2 [Toxorhynchites rutilus septentrionalis]